MIAELNPAVLQPSMELTITSYVIDDILLAGTSTSGLQKLIGVAAEHVTEHGLKFNPDKTTCMTLGKSHLSKDPSLTIGDSCPAHIDSMICLGGLLNNDGVNCKCKG